MISAGELWWTLASWPVLLVLAIAYWRIARGQVSPHCSPSHGAISGVHGECSVQYE